MLPPPRLAPGLRPPPPRPRVLSTSAEALGIPASRAFIASGGGPSSNGRSSSIEAPVIGFRQRAAPAGEPREPPSRRTGGADILGPRSSGNGPHRPPRRSGP